MSDDDGSRPKRKRRIPQDLDDFETQAKQVS